MAVRLRDVADRAGVSVKTVSNVVHKHVNVAPDTRLRVQVALDELGYRPNLSARSLRRGQSGIIALAVPEIDIPYFAELAGLVVRAAFAQGLTVLVDQTDGDAERERLVLRGLHGHLIDGLIMSPVALDADEIADHSGGPPLVLLGEKISDVVADHVAIDNVAASRAATEHVLDLGRTRVALIGDQPDSPTGSGVARLRRQGYEAALAAHGIALEPELMRSTPTFTRADGAAATSLLLDSGAAPDGVFCFNDSLALGAMRVLAERGLRVPEDVAVIGIDDIVDGRWSTPTLSTVAPDKSQIAACAVRMLLNRMGVSAADATSEPAADVRAEFAVIPRESTLGR